MQINGRDIKVFPKETHLRSSEEKWGVSKLPQRKRERKKLLVLGTGRCGTDFTTKALKSVGVDVGHEKVGPDGTVSHYFVIDSDWYPMAPWQVKQGKKHVGERRSDFLFDHVFHVVRDPLKTIPSMTKIFGSVTWQFYVDNGLIPPGIKSSMERAMYLWLAHNEIAEAQADITFPVEKYEKVWPTLMDMLMGPGSIPPYPKHLRPTNRTTGFRKYEPATYGDLQRIDRPLAEAIERMANRYGYKT